MIYFITGTDTGVGKTTVAAALAQRCRREGSQVRYFKPVQTGLMPGEPGDADFVAAAAGIEVEEGQRFPAALAPVVAAEEAGKTVDYPRHLETARRLASGCDMLLVEGAGGLLVPLTRASDTEPGLSMADLARDLGEGTETQVVIVTRPTLGTLNHTALTLEAVRTRNLRVAGLVICGWPKEVGVVLHTNLRELSEMAPILGIVGVCDGLDTAVPGPVELPFLAVPAAAG